MGKNDPKLCDNLHMWANALTYAHFKENLYWQLYGFFFLLLLFKIFYKAC